MADSSYHAEVKNIEQFLSLQKPTAPVKRMQPLNAADANVEPADFVATRFLKKSKAKVSLTGCCGWIYFETPHSWLLKNGSCPTFI